MKEKRRFEKSYLIVLGIISLFLVVGYSSYALFTVKKENKEAIRIVTGTLTGTLTSEDSAFQDNKLTVDANTKKEITIKLTNNNSIQAKLNFYYLDNISEKVHINYYKDTPNRPPTKEGVVLEQGASESYHLRIYNLTNSSITVEFRSDGGLANKELAFPNDGKVIEEIKTGIETLLTSYTNTENAIFNNDTKDKMFIYHHERGEQQSRWDDDELTDFRYIGANPNNYVTFNNEDAGWRIIGVFTVEDENGKKEKKIKIIKQDSLGLKVWNSDNNNDWSQSSLMKEINSNEEEKNPLNFTEEAKTMISKIKWPLGSSNTAILTADEFYQAERGIKVYQDRPILWIGEIGLMYPSDYGYATSGGSEKNRQECLATALYNIINMGNNCIDNNWLYKNENQWTILPDFANFNYAFYRDNSGTIGGYAIVTNRAYAYPVLFLDSSLEIFQGNGTKKDPFIFFKS